MSRHDDLITQLMQRHNLTFPQAIMRLHKIRHAWIEMALDGGKIKPKHEPEVLAAIARKKRRG